MRMDLARGRERRSTTATEDAEIDFMNIKQQGVDTGTELLQSTQGHAVVGLCLGGCIERNFFFFLLVIQISEIQTGIQTK